MKSFRILIVEDNLVFAVRMEEKLEEWGHQVLGIIDNGNEAIETAKKIIPDIILMDINLMGDYNGIEVAQNLKDLNIPIIFITGEKDEATFKAALDSHGVSYLVKPFDMLSLRGAIELASSKSNLSPTLENRIIEEENLPDEPIADTQKLYFKSGKELVQVNLMDLNWLESDRNYCDLYTNDRRFTLRISLRKLLQQLPADKFMKIHKRFVVRIDAIDKVVLSENKVYIGEEAISLGRKFRADFLKRIKRI